MIFMAPKAIYQRCIVHPWSIRRLQEQRETPQVMSSAPICTEMWARRGTQLLTRWKGSGEIWSHLVILVGSGWFWLVSFFLGFIAVGVFQVFDALGHRAREWCGDRPWCSVCMHMRSSIIRFFEKFENVEWFECWCFRILWGSKTVAVGLCCA